jgi:hypothetical protein
MQMSGLPDGVHGLDARGTVNAGDYAAVFEPLIDQLRENGRRLRLLYQFGPSFTRFTAGALWADSRLGAHYLPLMDGCALVTDIEWIKAPGRSIAAWLPCPMRIYDDARTSIGRSDRESLYRWNRWRDDQHRKALVDATISKVTVVVLDTDACLRRLCCHHHSQTVPAAASIAR